ncbi:hypothetical protein GW17_00002445 [Ensete ventricosum]|nr:hypothetical protein GW17_00002445 [Ensete ventricosum]
MYRPVSAVSIGISDLAYSHYCPEVPPSLSKLTSTFVLQKRTKGEETPTGKESSSQETEDDEDEKEDDLSEEENVHKHSEIETKEIKSVEVADEDENNDDDDVNEYGEKKLGKSKQEKKKSVKPRGSVAKENLKLNTSLKKNSLPTTTKRSAKRSISKCSMAEEENETSTKVFTSKKRNLDFPNKKSTPKSNRKDKATGHIHRHTQTAW